MEREALKELLHNAEVDVTFEKKDGTIREMRCTLKADLLPPMQVKEDATPRKENLDVLRVYDLEKKDWRAFRLDSIIDVKVDANTVD